MTAKVYLNLLVLIYGVWCQGIMGTVLEKDIGGSSDLLVREKRVINRIPGQDIRQPLNNVRYIVFIKERRAKDHCAGVILSAHIVLTVARCFVHDHTMYRVFSGTASLVLTGHYTTHNVVGIRTFKGSHPLRANDGISLVVVNQPFVPTSRSAHKIGFYEGNLAPDTHGTVSGWGCDDGENPGTAHPQNLRSITVPIISLQECKDIYKHAFPITESDICTLDRTGQQYCGIHDAGAPLVVYVNSEPYLVGIHLWNGGIVGQNNPDVYINLQEHFYKNWIQLNLREIEGSQH